MSEAVGPPIDTCLAQETPEGVELTLTPAGPLARGLAWAVDLALRAVVYVAGGIGLASLGAFGMGIGLVLAFLLEWGYPVWFEYRSGATPGKRALGLCVVADDGAPLTLGAAVLRNLVRFVDFLPAGYLFGLSACLISGRFQRLGDIAAGTLVIYAERNVTRKLADAVPARPPFVPLSLDEQRAIVAFAERARGWSEERREELAAHTGPCTRGRPDERVRQLLGFARWIAGER
jgi:uncharacterized RDD family membrane protein YckC